ncbi:MAG: peptidoglycan DD-metalloendopeptidase family protein [Pseudomonadota bacterium]|nr:peptidoglycan DD-metalloendopeptidase family protein [Pseudomonadota bacterium]
MKPTPRLALLTLSIALLAACQTPTRKAPVVERSSAASPSNYRPVTPTVVEETRSDVRGSYTVKRGDTLLRIALDHGQNYRDLVAWNNLADANDIKVGQVLRVAPQNGVAERTAGVTTSPISMPPGDTRPSGVAGLKKTPPPAPAVSRKPAEVIADTRSGEPARPDVTAPAAPVITAPPATAGATDEERVSWIWPSEGRVVGSFEEGKNKGIDIAGKAGQKVVAASGGKVMYAGSGIRGYGNLVIVKHSNNVLSAYAHNRAIVVKEGDPVVKGQTIAEMGNSDSDIVKLHFEIRQQGKPVDPMRFLPGR